MNDTRPERQTEVPALPPAPEAGSVPVEIPATVSPWETWHSEAYLIAHLTRHHGWFAVAPGRLQRVRSKPRRFVSAPVRSEVA